MNSRVTIILVIMAIYLAGMLWIGLKGRKYSETNKDFMTAAKQGSMLLVVGSYLGSHLGNGVVVGGAQYGALYGIGGLWYGAGAALSFVLFALVMSKIVYKKGYLTLPDVLSDRYGGKVVSVLIAILHYCTMIAICAGQIMAGRLLFEYVGLPGTAGAAITFIIVIGYSTMSGLWGGSDDRCGAEFHHLCRHYCRRDLDFCTGWLECYDSKFAGDQLPDYAF